MADSQDDRPLAVQIQELRDRANKILFDIMLSRLDFTKMAESSHSARLADVRMMEKDEKICKIWENLDQMEMLIKETLAIADNEEEKKCIKNDIEEMFNDALK